MTVVDAAAVSAELAAADGLAERAMAAGLDDARTIADLIMDQIEFADTLILNKCDVVPKVCPYGLLKTFRVHHNMSSPLLWCRLYPGNIYLLFSTASTTYLSGLTRKGCWN